MLLSFNFKIAGFIAGPHRYSLTVPHDPRRNLYAPVSVGRSTCYYRLFPAFCQAIRRNDLPTAVISRLPRKGLVLCSFVQAARKRDYQLFPPDLVCDLTRRKLIPAVFLRLLFTPPRYFRCVAGEPLLLYPGVFILPTTIHRFHQENNQYPPIRTFGYHFPPDHRPDLTSGRFCGKLTG